MNRWVALGAGLLIVLCALALYKGLDGGPASVDERVADDVERPLDPNAIAAAPPLAPTLSAPAQLPPASKPDAAIAERSNVHAAAAPIPASGYFDELQRAFESEARDGSWASEQEARIPQLLAEAGFADDAFDRNATCRRTLCRFSLRIAEGDALALMKLAAKVQTSEGLTLAHGSAEPAGEKARIVVYIPREGASLQELRER